MKNSRKIDEYEISRAVYRHWMDTGQSATPQEIADRIGCSSSTVYKRMNAVSYFIPDTDCEAKDIEVRSDSYRWMTSTRSVNAWAPSKEKLWAVIKEYEEERS